MPDQDHRSGPVTRFFPWFFFPALLGISLYLTLRVHSDTGRFNWKSEIFADAAGYYAYLPVTFLYQFDYGKFPVGINDSTGCGFVDHKQKKFVYRYTCGVALLLSPFFAGTALVSGILGMPLDGGYSEAFHRMADIAAVCYLLLGLFLTGKVLKRYTGTVARYVTLLVIFAGTNLYFYSIRQPLMSHVYSFAVISLFILALHRYLEKKTSATFLLVAFSAALAILIRPVNGIILILLPFWDTGSLRGAWDRIRLLLAWKQSLLFIAVLLLVLLPQMLYWYYMFGTPLHYAYAGESFSNWKLPHLAEIWFSPLNGLFLYNPAWLVCIAGTVLMIGARQKNGLLLLLFFLLFSYIVASWHSWFFGCGYGHRAFVDILPLFAIPFGVAVEKAIRIRTRIPGILLILLLAGMSWYNLRLIYSYNGCFFGSVWDWPRFSRHLNWAGLWKHQDRVFVFTNDFETGMISQGDPHTDSTSRSYNYSILFDQNRRMGCRKFFYFYEFAQPFPTHAGIRVFIKAPDGRIGGAMFFCRIERKGQLLWRDSSRIDTTPIVAGKWCKAEHTFTFPPDNPWDATISFGIWNPGGAHFYADDQKIVLY